MNPDDARTWQNTVLDEVFLAIATDPDLTSILIFKGARVLARRVPEAARQSLDLDANCREGFLTRYPEREQQATVLRELLTVALRRHFESQSPVRYEVDGIRVEAKPPRGHPHGWDGLEAHIRVRDLSRPTTHGLPFLSLDVASPEHLTDHSTTTLEIGAHRVTVYTLERIAGEKLRAFLSTTPAYQSEKAGTRQTLRVKDLPDLARIVEHTPLSDNAFWQIVGRDFRDACQSRGVDCAGWSTFEAVAGQARDTYNKDATVATSMPFDRAWAAVKAIVNRLEAERVVPFEFPMPPRTASARE